MVAHQATIDMALSKQGPDIPRCMRYAKQAKGKSYIAQVAEIFTLSRGPGKLTPQDYYYYRLYDDAQFDSAAKRRFLSERVHFGIIKRCCDVRWWAMADDKLAANSILQAHGAPIPELQAAYDPGFRRIPGRAVRTGGDLAEFLRHQARYPLFAKQVDGVASFGAWSLEGHDANGDELVLAGGARISLDDFVAQVTDAGSDGYVFETRLSPHPDIRTICGERVSTVRMVLILPKDGPEILHAVWKISVGANIADNFWRSGNMLAAVDQASGRVARVIQGTGPDLVEVDVHPDTGKLLRGAVLPDWDRLRRLCLECAAIFPKLRYQSWDIALCPEGPVIVEVNTGSAFLLPQLATGMGFLDDRFQAFLESC
jgi:hypothetical protein